MKLDPRAIAWLRQRLYLRDRWASSGGGIAGAGLFRSVRLEMSTVGPSDNAADQKTIPVQHKMVEMIGRRTYDGTNGQIETVGYRDLTGTRPAFRERS